MSKEEQGKEIIRYTACGHHCANDACPIKVHIRDGKITAIEPDDTINPGMAREDSYLSREEIDKSSVQIRPCAKAFVQVAMLTDPKRVIHPMKRVGKKGEGKFERITWDEAIDTVARKLVEVKEKYGPHSIGDNFPLAPWFGAGVRGWGSHSSQGWAETMQWVLGIRVHTERTDEANMFDAKLIVLWGTNHPTTLGNAASHNFIRARERGIPVICIEPRYTASAETLADQWIPIRPTTDASMMIAMANVWFKEDLTDKEFIAKYVEPEGLRKWKDYVLGATDGVDKTPQWAEKICGVPAQTIAEFARLYARSKPVHLNASLTLGRQFHGENTTRAIMYLQALTGNTTIHGGTAGADSGHVFGDHGLALPKPGSDWRRAEGTYRAPIMGIHFRWPLAVDLREKYESGQMTKEEYNRAIANPPDNEPPNIRMAILQQGNPLVAHPDVNANIRAYKKLDFLVVFSYYADEPSSRYADILLPQINQHYEGRDGGVQAEGGMGPRGGGGEFSRGDFFLTSRNLSENCFVYRQKCADPPGEVRPREWFWVQLAKKLGFGEQYSPRLVNVPYGKWEETMEDIQKEAYEYWAALPEIVPMKPPTWEEFQKKPVFRWQPEVYYPFKKALEAGENPFKGTESGKIEFYNKKLADKSGLAAKEFAPGKWYGPGRLPPMAEATLEGKATFFSQDTKKYPLLMSTPHPLFRIHSMFDNQPLVSEDCFRHAVWINVADAKARGIVDNQQVKVYNDQGEMVLPAYVTSRTVPGTVVVFHGAWYMPGPVKTKLMPEGIDMRGSANVLTAHDEHLPDTIINHLPCKGLVEVKKWDGK